MSNEAPESPKSYAPNLINDFLVALVFLTRLPLHLNMEFSMKAVGHASRCFPLVGLVIGGLGGAAFLVTQYMNLPVLVSALIAIAVQVLLTGALHEDAIGDVADGFGGGIDKAKKLEIMRDSRVGTYAVVTLILVIASKAAAIASFTNPNAAFAVILSGAVASRGMMSMGLYLLPPARTDGLGASAGKPPLLSLLWAIAFTLTLPALILGPFAGSAALLAAIAGAAVMSFIAWRQIGGQTGDVIGSLQQISEIAFLLTLSALLG